MQHPGTTLGQTIQRCRERLDIVGVGLGSILFVGGGLLSASIYGAVVGIPLLLIAFPLLAKPRRSEVCT